jgi:hypothetical protein
MTPKNAAFSSTSRPHAVDHATANDDDSPDKAITPASTGAQHALATPENSPRV